MNSVISDMCDTAKACVSTHPVSLYKSEYTLESRRRKHERKKLENPESIIVVVDPHGGIPFKNGRPYMKFVVSKDFTYAQLIVTIRKFISVSAEQAVFVLLEGGTLPCSTQALSRVHAEHSDPDGALYARVMTENTFGAAGDGAFEECFMWASTFGSVGIMAGALMGYTYSRCLDKCMPSRKNQTCQCQHVVDIARAFAAGSAPPPPYVDPPTAAAAVAVAETDE